MLVCVHAFLCLIIKVLEHYEDTSKIEMCNKNIISYFFLLYI